MNTLGIFAKYWQPGQVKTRLGSAIGYLPSSQIHRRFFDCLQQRFRSIADQRVIVIWPPDSKDQFVDSIDSNWQVRLQTEGDLGQKMSAFFAEQFELGTEKVILIGSDCPHLQVETVQTAFARLDDKDLVLGPSMDGGYYLIGMRKQLLDVFKGVHWSTPQVFSQTLERIESNGCSYAVLEQNFDVDTEADLRQFLNLDLKAFGSETADSLSVLRGEIQRILDGTIDSPGSEMTV